ncbi:Ligand-binding SRPBCC domain-containing protein [Pseudarcicella hirudinis]|uniref:Ligand-binding SRPBCC domain-containing protein n=1 Tax=Pseudarcicella hirudinis TaxID=1079859 RepID=A0A1I5USJ2_9BACT|nr:SRPBCC family protein [Pseudarcicella hirudinis]SFP98274.1 Ligand-binding SRPBCC domain-containing protein [Pseudarcicella hirudinis]
MGIYTLERTQAIPSSLEKVWDFISSPDNLKVITPDYMGFDIVSRNLSSKMYPGMIISYKVSPLMGLKFLWVTEITQVKEFEFFVDEQRVGPYKFWHHQHHLKEIDGGVLMTDIVNYQPPFGILGDLCNTLIIRKKLQEIFNFRTQKVQELFGKF